MNTEIITFVLAVLVYTVVGYSVRHGLWHKTPGGRVGKVV
jgi:hypothetical protein